MSEEAKKPNKFEIVENDLDIDFDHGDAAIYFKDGQIFLRYNPELIDKPTESMSTACVISMFVQDPKNIEYMIDTVFPDSKQ